MSPVRSHGTGATDGYQAIRVARTLTEAEALRDEWEALLKVSPGSTIYQSPSWVLEWYRTFGGRWCVHLVVLRHADGALAAIAPFARASLGPWSWLPQCLISVGAEHDGSGEILVHPDLPGAAREIVEFLDAMVTTKLTIVRVGGVDVRGAYGQALLDSRSNRRIQSQAESSVLDLANGDASIVEQLIRKHRVPRRRRRLEEAHGELEIAAGDGPMADVLADMRRLLLARWGPDAGPAAWATEQRALFTSRVFSQLCVEDRARAVSLIVDGRRVAIQLVTNVQDRYVFEMIGHDVDMPQFGLGNQVMAEALRHVCTLGATEVDFRAPAMDYKDAWASERRQISTAILVRPGLYGKLSLRPYSLMRRWRRRYLGRST